MNNHINPKIGEIYLMNFDGSGSEQHGWRPGLVFQNNTGNINSPNIIALPLTTAIKKAGQPTHVVIPCKGTGLIKDSMVLCENPERMSKDRVGRYLTTLSDELMAKVAESALLAFGICAYISTESFKSIIAKSIHLNAIS